MATNSRTFIPHVLKNLQLVPKLKVGRGRGREVSKFAHVLICKSLQYFYRWDGGVKMTSS